MSEFTFWNETTQEERIAFGYSDRDARRRWGLGEEWECIWCEYID